MEKKKLVVLSGAGISAESGIPTFRDAGGLWEKYNIEEVASIDGWKNDKVKVLNFHNEVRNELVKCQPNSAHYALAKLEEMYDVTIVTQNIDTLHEQAGSTNVIHIHGNINEKRSTCNPKDIYDLGEDEDINLGDKCFLGSQYRHNVVWFGEKLQYLDEAVEFIEEADILVIIGTSMNVQPAASFYQLAKRGAHLYYIDPMPVILPVKCEYIEDKATIGCEKLLNMLM